jgi:hypothetical protein
MSPGSELQARSTRLTDLTQLEVRQMATIQYSLLRVASTLGGLVLVGVAASLNVYHAAESEGTYWSPVCVAIVALAFGSALAVPVMLTLWRTGRRGLALVGLVGLVCNETYGFQRSAERLLAARDQRAQQVKTDGSPYQLAREALDLSIKDRRVECTATRGSVKYCDQLRSREEKGAYRAVEDSRAQVACTARGRHGPTGMGRGDCSGDGLPDLPADTRSRARRLQRAQHEGKGSGGTGGEA